MVAMQTPRLLLRPWRKEDLGDFYAYAKDPQIGPNAGWKPHGSLEESREILKTFVGNEEVGAIVLRDTGRVVGSLGLDRDRLFHDEDGPCREVGCALSRSCWGLGLMTEAVRRTEKYAFEEMGLALLSAAHFPFNARSRRVIEKCGFRYEKTLRASFTDYRGVRQDEVCYLMTREDYEALVRKRFHAAPLTEGNGRKICSWRYPQPYTVYNLPDWEEFFAEKWAMAAADRRKSENFVLLDDSGSLCGFFRFFSRGGTRMLRLGMKPELCGLGYGRRALGLILREFIFLHQDEPLELEVRSFNRRALACFRGVGFEETARYRRKTQFGPEEFVRMEFGGKDVI